MGYCYHLYTPNMKEQDSGKFVACDKLLMTDPIMNMTTIGYYEAYFNHKYLDIYDSVVVLNEDQCLTADKYTETTFFTDFIKENK